MGCERVRKTLDENGCAHSQDEDRNRQHAMIGPRMRKHLPGDKRRYANIHEAVKVSDNRRSVVQPPVQAGARDRRDEGSGKLEHDKCLNANAVT